MKSTEITKILELKDIKRKIPSDCNISSVFPKRKHLP